MLRWISGVLFVLGCVLNFFFIYLILYYFFKALCSFWSLMAMTTLKEFWQAQIRYRDTHESHLTFEPLLKLSPDALWWKWSFRLSCTNVRYERKRGILQPHIRLGNFLVVCDVCGIESVAVTYGIVEMIGSTGHRERVLVDGQNGVNVYESMLRYSFN